MRDPALSGWRRLGCAVILQAHRDAQDRHGPQAADARAFLAGSGAAWLAAALDLPPEGPAQAVGSLPPPDYEQMALSL